MNNLRSSDYTNGPDIVLLSAARRSRALLRAELIERGFEVVAAGTWLTARRHLRPASARPPSSELRRGRPVGKPHLLIVDLQELPDPQTTLDQVGVLMKPDRVLVIGATCTVSPDYVRRLGFHFLSRPVTIGTIAAEAARLVTRQTSDY